MENGVRGSGIFPALPACAFGVVALLKLALLWLYGPIHTPDTGGYIGYAAAMLKSTAWLHDAGLADNAVPLLAVRMAGYPAVLAGAQLLFGPAWEYAVVFLQYALSFAASYAMYRLALELTLPPRLALAVTLAQMTTLSLTFDQCLLTDSLNCSFIMLAIYALVHGAPTGQPLRWRQALFAGAMFALALLMRDAMQILIVALLPLILVRLWLVGRRYWRMSTLACVLVLAPMAVVAQAYKGWNEYRTGVRFLSTVPQLTLLFALGKIVDKAPEMFDGDTPVDRAGRKYFRSNPFGEIGPVNQQLFDEGYRATDIARMAYTKYFSAWKEHPSAMFKLFHRNTSEKAAKLGIRPLAATCETIEYGSGDRQCYDYRDLYRSLPSGFSGFPFAPAAAMFIALTIEQTTAILLFAGFLLGLPITVLSRLYRQGFAPDGITLTMTAFWVTYVTWYMAYGLIHVEDRYMMPVLLCSLIGGGFAWNEIWSGRNMRAQATS